MMMKLRILLVLLALAFATIAPAATVNTYTLTVTNVPVTSNTAVIAAKTLTWTNATTSTTILTNSTGVNGSATNLYSQLGSFPIAGVTVRMTDTNVLTLRGDGLVISQSGNWCSLVLVSRPATNTYSFTIPLENLPTPAQATNDASVALRGIAKFATNQVDPTSPAFTNFLNKGSGSQVVTGYVIFIYGLGGTNLGLTNGPIFGSALLQVSLNATGGYSTNLILDRCITTNLINYGNALSSRGTNTGSEQFGANANAQGPSSLAVGKDASAFQTQDTAVGNGAQANAGKATAVGSGALASGWYSTAIGANSSAEGSNSIVIGVFADANGFADTITLGTLASATGTNQIVLGSSSYKVLIPGRLADATATNLTTTGTNVFGGDASFPRYDNAALANGNNAAILIGTNRYMAVSGPTAAYTLNGFQGGRNGKTFILEKDDSFTMTIANDSGVDPTAANRILNGTGGDITVTNNPGFVEFVYNSARSRWCVKNKSN